METTLVVVVVVLLVLQLQPWSNGLKPLGLFGLLAWGQRRKLIAKQAKLDFTGYMLLKVARLRHLQDENVPPPEVEAKNSPEIAEFVRERDQHRTRLAAFCKKHPEYAKCF